MPLYPDLPRRSIHFDDPEDNVPAGTLRPRAMHQQSGYSHHMSNLDFTEDYEPMTNDNIGQHHHRNTKSLRSGHSYGWRGSTNSNEEDDGYAFEGQDDSDQELPPEDYAERTPSDSSPSVLWDLWMNYKYVCIVLGLAVILIFGRISFGTKDDDTMGLSVEEQHRVIKETWGKFRQEFMGQDTNFWAILFSALKQTLDQKNHEPSCVLLIARPGMKGRRDQFLARFVEELSFAFHSRSHRSDKLLFDATNFTRGYPSPDTLSERVFEGLRAALNGQVRAGAPGMVALTNFDSLPATTATVLHSFCDNDNAPFKHALILLSATIPPDSIANTKPTWEQAATDMLRSAWLNKQSFNEDRLGALMSRIGNHIILFR